MNARTMRIVTGFLGMLMVLGMLTGCMNTGGTPAATPTPAVAAVTPLPTYQGNQSGGATTPGANETKTAFDWMKDSSRIEANVAKISEIQEARIVVNGSTALAAVKFSSAYQGDLTERIREMVASEVMKADPSIKTVAVTAEENDVNQVYTIADKLAEGSGLEEVASDIDKIVRNATTLR